MRVAVITPYYKEDLRYLQRCHDSVKGQTHNTVTHIMVADGIPNPILDSWDIQHLKLPVGHRDYGDTPRAMASISAATQGFDALTYLDADNWFEPDHVETLLRLHRETGADILTTTRMLRRPDETPLGICNETNGESFNDTNCYLLMKPTFPAFAGWVFKDPREGIVGDRVFWRTLLGMGLRKAHCAKPTVNYETTFATHYLQRGETPPDGCKVIVRFVGEEYDRMLSYEDFKAILERQKK